MHLSPPRSCNRLAAARANSPLAWGPAAKGVGFCHLITDLSFLIARMMTVFIIKLLDNLLAYGGGWIITPASAWLTIWFNYWSLAEVWQGGTEEELGPWSVILRRSKKTLVMNGFFFQLLRMGRSSPGSSKPIRGWRSQDGWFSRRWERMEGIVGI